MKHLIFIPFALLLGAASSVIGDRLLIEIDHTPYTQRQMQMYLLCKDILFNEQVRQGSIDLWDEMLDEFKMDMIIHQEALRLGSFEASSRILGKSLEVFGKNVSESETIARQLASLGGKEAQIRKFVGVALRIEAFKVSKHRQAAVQSQANETTVVRSAGAEKWQLELASRVVIRYFRNATVYQEIKF